jgi:hypothetical protein
MLVHLQVMFKAPTRSYQFLLIELQINPLSTAPPLRVRRKRVKTSRKVVNAHLTRVSGDENILTTHIAALVRGGWLGSRMCSLTWIIQDANSKNL